MAASPCCAFKRRRRRHNYLAVLCFAFVLSVQGFSIWRQQSFHPLRETDRSTKFLATTSGEELDKRQPTKRRRRPNNRTALRWVVESIERLGKDQESSLERPSDALLVALRQLQRARTQREVAEAGRLLESLNISETESVDVQERVMKAASLSGLLTLALQLADGLLEKGILPSAFAYVPLCNSLRQVGRVQRLEKLLYQLGELSEDHGVDVLALNTYLAAVCRDLQDALQLEHARDWLRPGMAARRLGGTEPNVETYATVMNAAAKMGNRPMVDKLWEEMTETRKLKPTIYTYNSLLRVVRNGPNGMAEACDLLDGLLREVEPDQYTIDLVLVPLMRANRLGDVESLLGKFVERRSVDARTASRAFEAFLDTLIKAGELPTAQALFDTYLSPSKSAEDDDKIIRPTVRHFNLLIEGYRRVAESNQRKIASEAFEEEVEELKDSDKFCRARENALALYSMMLSTGLSPDAYTLTSLLSLMSTSTDVTDIFREATLEHGVRVTPSVLRAVMAAYGTSGDPATACFVFDEYGGGGTNARTWNALLSALRSGAMLDNAGVISVDSSSEAAVLSSSSDQSVACQGICKLVNGLNTTVAAQRVLHVMERGGDASIGIKRAPRPNSQTYCVAASALQYDPESTSLALGLFRNATSSKLPADGRFINAVFRCFGGDIDGALSAWKSEIRRACLEHEYRTRSAPVSVRRVKGKNLIAAYHGLFYVCGRALRPDIAVRLVYAMAKEKLEANEVALNCYRAGKGVRQKLANQNGDSIETTGIGLSITKQFESILLVECTKYEVNDVRRAGERRVRIIL